MTAEKLLSVAQNDIVISRGCKQEGEELIRQIKDAHKATKQEEE